MSLALWLMGWIDPWEAKSWDLRVSLLAKPGKATDNIRVIKVDQGSLDWAEQENALPWVWPREVFGAIVNYCRRSGAKALAFDVLFTEFSSWGVEDDESFGAAISEFANFAGALTLRDTESKEA